MNRNALKITGAAVALAAAAHMPSANAASVEQAPSSDTRHALKQARDAGKLAAEHALGDMRAEVHAKGSVNLRPTETDVIVAVEQPEEGQPFIFASVDGDTKTVIVSEGTTLNMTQPDRPQNSVVAQFDVIDMSPIDTKLAAGKKVTVRDIGKTLVGARLTSLEVATDAYKPGNFKTLDFNGIHTQFTTGPSDQANAFVTANERQVTAVTQATHYVDSVLSASPQV